MGTKQNIEGSGNLEILKKNASAGTTNLGEKKELKLSGGGEKSRANIPETRDRGKRIGLMNAFPMSTVALEQEGFIQPPLKRRGKDL